MSNEFSKYFLIILTIVNVIALQGLVQVKMEDMPQATHLLQQGPSQIALQAPQHQCSATGHLKAWSLENPPKGCNVNDTFKFVASLTYPQMLGHNKKPFGIPDNNNLLSMQTIFNHIYKTIQSELGPTAPFLEWYVSLYLYLTHIMESMLTTHPLVPFLCE